MKFQENLFSKNLKMRCFMSESRSVPNFTPQHVLSRRYVKLEKFYSELIWALVGVELKKIIEYHRVFLLAK